MPHAAEPTPLPSPPTSSPVKQQAIAWPNPPRGPAPQARRPAWPHMASRSAGAMRPRRACETPPAAPPSRLLTVINSCGVRVRPPPAAPRGQPLRRGGAAPPPHPHAHATGATRSRKAGGTRPSGQDSVHDLEVRAGDVTRWSG